MQLLCIQCYHINMSCAHAIDPWHNNSEETGKTTWFTQVFKHMEYAVFAFCLHSCHQIWPCLLIEFVNFV